MHISSEVSQLCLELRFALADLIPRRWKKSPSFFGAGAVYLDVYFLNNWYLFSCLFLFPCFSESRNDELSEICQAVGLAVHLSYKLLLLRSHYCVHAVKPVCVLTVLS